MKTTITLAFALTSTILYAAASMAACAIGNCSPPAAATHTSELKIVVPFAIPVGVPVAPLAPYFYSYRETQLATFPNDPPSQSPAAPAESQPDATSPSVVELRCATCHGARAPKAGLSLAHLNQLTAADRLRAFALSFPAKCPKANPFPRASFAQSSTSWPPRQIQHRFRNFRSFLSRRIAMKRSLLIASVAAGLVHFAISASAKACPAQASACAAQAQFVVAPVVELHSFAVPVAVPPTVAVAAPAEIATTPAVVTAPIVAPVVTTPIVTAPIVTAPAVVIENAHVAKPKMAPRRVRVRIFSR